jgi:hypothetical protein
MSKYARIAIVVGVLCITSLGYAKPTYTVKKIASSGTTVISDKSAKVSITTREVQSNIDTASETGHPACKNDRSPCNVVTDITISVNETDIDVPLSVYADLSALSEATLSHNKDYILSLKGGDGGYAYVAKLVFDNTHVKKRLCCSDEPEKSLEDFTFRLPTPE